MTPSRFSSANSSMAVASAGWAAKVTFPAEPAAAGATLTTVTLNVAALLPDRICAPAEPLATAYWPFASPATPFTTRMSFLPGMTPEGIAVSLKSTTTSEVPAGVVGAVDTSAGVSSAPAWSWVVADIAVTVDSCEAATYLTPVVLSAICAVVRSAALIRCPYGTSLASTSTDVLVAAWWFQNTKPTAEAPIRATPRASTAGCRRARGGSG